MSRVLFWNLQTFGINKINDPTISRKRKKGIGGNTPQAASRDRWQVVANTLIAANPEIIVLVEVSSGDSYPIDVGTNTGGMEGAIYLLGRLRAATPAAGWRLVPPLRVGRRPGSKPETVAVFYRGSDGGITRYFTGPNVWVGGANGRSTIPGVGVAANAYPGGNPDLNAMLVPPGTVVRQIPAGALHNATRNENRVAARTRFRDRLDPTYFIDYGIYRPPYMVTFTEVQGINSRNVTLFGVHSPAVAGDPGVFISYLISTQEVMGPLGANETRAIGGDFNLQLLALNGGPSNIYQPLQPSYQPLLQSPGAPPVVDLSAFKGYFATHIKPKKTTADSLFLWSSAAVNSPYPGYGYIGSDFVANFYSIDNILVRPLQGPPYDYETTIMNGVTGPPFNLVNPVPGGAPEGTVALASQMTNPHPVVPWPPAPNAPQVNQGVRKNLVSWANYGRILSTSDHFAVFADV